MKIEIVEFYPFAKQSPNSLYGTLHVYICDLEMDLRGVEFYRDKVKWHVLMPYRWGTDPNTGKKCRYPIINLTNKRKNDLLKSEIKKLGIKYIEAMLKK